MIQRWQVFQKVVRMRGGEGYPERPSWTAVGFVYSSTIQRMCHLDKTLTKVPTAHGTCKKNGWNDFLECSGVAVAPEQLIMTSSLLRIRSSRELPGL